MYWNKSNISYDILIPPLKKHVSELDKLEAKEYFEWYLQCLPARISYLSEVSKCVLDGSFDSLIPLWHWFLIVAKIEKTPTAKLNMIKRFLNKQSNPFINEIIDESSTQFSLQTEYIIRDIGMYLGNVFVKFSDKIKWGYHTDIEKDSFANTPLLTGFEDAKFTPPFKMEFEPVHMTKVQASNIFDNTASDTDLYNLCLHWVSHIPK